MKRLYKTFENALVIAMCELLLAGCASSGLERDTDSLELHIETITPIEAGNAERAGFGAGDLEAQGVGEADPVLQDTTEATALQGKTEAVSSQDSPETSASLKSAASQDTTAKAATGDSTDNTTSQSAGASAAAGVATSQSAGASATPEAPATPQFYLDALRKYRDNAAVQQLLLVRYTGGSSAVAAYYLKDPTQPEGWSQDFETRACIGKNGLGKTREGDRKTPVGDFGVRQAFGIRPNPGTSIDFIPVKPTTYACEEEGPYYNQIIDIAETGHQCSSDGMYKASPQYNYGLATDYNPENIYPLGSAIFVHCIGDHDYTLGCVAIPENYMKEVLKTATPGIRVIIGKD